MPNEVSICRVCLSNNAVELNSIFDKYRESTIYEHITNLVNVKISEGDGLPSKICGPCLLELETAVNFKFKCETSDAYLHKNVYDDNANDPSSSGVKNEKLEILLKLEPDESEEYVEYLEPEFESLLKCHKGYNTPSPTSCLEDYPLIENSIEREEVTNEDDEISLFPPRPPINLQCHDCGEFFKSKCKLRVHWKKTHMVCEKCKKSFKTFSSYTKHIKNKKNCLKNDSVRIEGEGKYRTYHCMSCDYKAARMCAVIKHQVIHTGERPYQCDLCPKNYTQVGGLIGHKETAHQEYRVEITCNFCGKIVRGRCKAYQHLQTHSEYRYQCDHCKIFLKSRNSIMSHLKRHRGVKSFICDKCPMSFYNHGELKTHKRMKHEYTLLSCNICGYQVRSKKFIALHEKKHSIYDFYCSLCGAFFPTKIREILHQQVHEKKDTKIFTCPLCSRCYLSLDRVRAHVREKHSIEYGITEENITETQIKKQKAPTGLKLGKKSKA